MEKTRYPLRTNVGYFFNSPIGFSRSFHVDYPEIFIEPDLQAYNLVCDYSFSRTSEGLLLQATISADIDAECSRCLETCRIHVASEFEELYVFSTRALTETDDEIIPENGYIDLSVPFRDYLSVEIPINLACKPECRGICTQCGQNLNEVECEHTDSRVIFD